MKTLFLTLIIVLSANISIAQESQGMDIETPSPKESVNSEKDAREDDAWKKSFPVRIIDTPDNAKAAKERENKSDQHDADDLEAQQLAAKAAAQSAASADRQEYLATWQLRLSAFGIVALIGTLIYTHISINDNRRIGQAQVRAYLEVIPKKPYFFGEVIPDASFKIVNKGQSPAKNVRHIAALLIRNHPLESNRVDLIVAAPDQKIPASTIHSGGKYSAAAQRDSMMTSAEWDAVRWGDKRLYLAVHVFYDDVFGNGHVAKFCAFAGFVKLDGTDARAAQFPAGAVAWEVGWRISPTHNSAT